jgi:hypothetical protein
MARVRQWFHDKKVGWYAVLEDPQMPVTSTLLDQAHNAIDRKLFMMKAFHHPIGHQQAFLRGLAHLYNLVPYQRRAQHAGRCGVETECRAPHMFLGGAAWAPGRSRSAGRRSVTTLSHRSASWPAWRMRDLSIAAARTVEFLRRWRPRRDRQRRPRSDWYPLLQDSSKLRS